MSATYSARSHYAFIREIRLRRAPIHRTHFVPVPREQPAPDPVSYGVRVGKPVHIREYISKVYGASPAIVFAPPGPIASIMRTVKKAPSVKQRAAWDRYSAMMNDGGDHIRGYDDGECEPQTRGIHVDD